MLNLHPKKWLFVLLYIAALAGCHHADPVAEEEIRPAPVKVVLARLLVIGQKTDLLGTTQALPNHLARISAPFEGRLFSILKTPDGKAVDEGQLVKAGDVIAQLDVRLLEASRAEAVATLEEMNEQKKQAEYAVQQASLEVKRLDDLAMLDQGSSSKLVRPIEKEKARLAWQDAESKLRGAIARQTAGLAKVKSLNDQIDLSTLRSPIAGRLGLLQVVPGQSLAVGVAVAEVLDLAEIDVISYVPQHTVTQLAIGMPARIKSTEESAAKESNGPLGRIVYIAQQAQAETGNYAVKIRFPNPDLKLKANAVVTVEVQIEEDKQRMTIPDSALMEDRDPPGVVVLDDSKIEKTRDGKEEQRGKARVLRATIGVRDRSWHVVELLSLENAETKEMVPLKDALIIIEGGHGLHDGDLVKIQAEED